MTYSITKNGKPLFKDLYTICEETKTFSSGEDDLVLDFGYEDGWTFNTGWDCTFKTGGNCTFNTGGRCTFTTGGQCTFNTGDECTFSTIGNCIFDTGDYCTFNTSWNGTFNTGGRCTFNTGWNCTFTTGDECTFNTGSTCTFKTGSYCILISRLEETKTVLIKEPTEFKCTEADLLFKVGDEYVTQTEYEMYKELIS